MQSDGPFVAIVLSREYITAWLQKWPQSSSSHFGCFMSLFRCVVMVGFGSGWWLGGAVWFGIYIQTLTHHAATHPDTL